jgi:hypothetical protein
MFFISSFLVALRMLVPTGKVSSASRAQDVVCVKRLTPFMHWNLKQVRANGPSAPMVSITQLPEFIGCIQLLLSLGCPGPLGYARQILNEPVFRELSDGLQCSGFLKEVRCARHYFELLLPC